jgi:hypothetical protein
MALDDALLQEAEAARDRAARLKAELEAARLSITRLEREFSRAKVEYGDAIRALHGAGGTVPELAAALGVSEDAVHTVVARRQEGYTPVLQCSFCGTPDDEHHNLIAGPGVYICNDCVSLAYRVAAGGAEERPVAMRAVPEEEAATCSFCGKSRRMIRHLLENARARICDECLELCDEILAEGYGI